MLGLYLKSYPKWFTLRCSPNLKVFVLNCFYISNLALAQEAVPGEYIIKYNHDLNSIHANIISEAVGLNNVELLNDGDLFLAKEDKKIPLNTEAIEDLVTAGVIESFEPNYLGHIISTPNDSRYGELWGLNNTGASGGTLNVDIDAPEAWELTRGDSNVIVAVIDKGVLYTHPDLQNNMWVNPSEVPANGIDDDANGVIDDIHGYNAITNSGTPLDDRGHGSHCAGTIAGTGNNNIGVIGIAHNAKIMSVKAFGSDGVGALANVAKALSYVINQKQKGLNIKVINNSYGGFPNSVIFKNLISQASSNGILFVVAAGNNAKNNDTTPYYPASYDLPNVIAVAAIDRAGNLANFSNFGANSVHIAAPGVGILSTVLGNTYHFYHGTSMAAPHVTGVAALLASREPSISPAAMKSRILSSAKPLTNLTGFVKSGGMVSASRALSSAQSPPRNKPIFSDYDGDGISDLIVWRPSTAVWYILKSTTGFDSLAADNYQWGLLGDIPLLGDFDGDKKADLVVWRPSNGIWYIKSSKTNYQGGIVIQWGANGDLPIVGDVDGDSISDITVYRRTSGSFYSLLSSGGFNRDAALTGSNAAMKQIALGGLANDPVMGDFNGDGTDDYVTLWQLIRFWQIKSSDGIFLGSLPWGNPGDTPRGCDFNNDAIDDRIIIRENSSYTLDWFGALTGAGVSSFTFGSLGDVPGCRHDYDGDGKREAVVFRPNSGNWYLRDAQTGNLISHQFGLPGDIAMLF
jgi:subtilisin family serine protease